MDNLSRFLHILRLIPQQPKSISTTEIWEKLKNNHFYQDLSQRTVQRDLQKIQATKLLPLDYEKNSKPLRWHFKKEDATFQASMTEEEAIALGLVKTFLAKLLPPAEQDRIVNVFQIADETLKKSNLSSWIDKVRTAPSNLELLSPEIDQVMLNVIYEALLKNTCIKATYHPLETELHKDMIINPLGLVMRHNIGYLLGTSEEYEEPKQFALHRFQNVKIHERDAKIPKDFSLEKYIADGGFEYPIKNAPAKINVKFVIKDYMKSILTETPLSANQVITDYKDNFYLLEATVKNTRQLRWWILSFEPGIVILEPPELRQEFIKTLNESTGLYQKFQILN